MAKETVQIELKYNTAITELGDVRLAAQPDVSELRVAVFADEFVDDNSGDTVETGMNQIHMSGSSDALMEFGKFLIAVASERDLPRDFQTHLEPVDGGSNSKPAHIVIHHSVTESPEKTVRVGRVMEVDEHQLP